MYVLTVVKLFDWMANRFLFALHNSTSKFLFHLILCHKQMTLYYAPGKSMWTLLLYAQIGSILFCLALCHKQMTLYYAPAFFGHLLGKCLRRPTALGKVSKCQWLSLSPSLSLSLYFSLSLTLFLSHTHTLSLSQTHMHPYVVVYH